MAWIATPFSWILLIKGVYKRGRVNLKLETWYGRSKKEMQSGPNRLKKFMSNASFCFLNLYKKTFSI